jgi:hypothetical protein
MMDLLCGITFLLRVYANKNLGRMAVSHLASPSCSNTSCDECSLLDKRGQNIHVGLSCTVVNTILGAVWNEYQARQSPGYSDNNKWCSQNLVRQPIL